MGNWNLSNGDAPILTKYKIGFFIEWRLADRYKKSGTIPLIMCWRRKKRIIRSW
ncbi:MAG: hypothetical protein ACLR2E_15305 [Lachnospiraceae bacterium]